jgi:hypothetical protein
LTLSLFGGRRIKALQLYFFDLTLYVTIGQGFSTAGHLLLLAINFLLNLHLSL